MADGIVAHGEARKAQLRVEAHGRAQNTGRRRESSKRTARHEGSASSNESVLCRAQEMGSAKEAVFILECSKKIPAAQTVI